jgi:methylmalonyl-CoA mutase C-terminal domain/subunit
MIGLSILSGAHLELFPRIVDELKKRDMAEVVLFAGGIIPDEDRAKLQTMGFKGIFGPGASTLDIIDWVKDNTPSAAAA